MQITADPPLRLSLNEQTSEWATLGGGGGRTFKNHTQQINVKVHSPWYFYISRKNNAHVVEYTNALIWRAPEQGNEAAAQTSHLRKLMCKKSEEL